MPIDLAPEKLTELVTSDTRRHLLIEPDGLIMIDPTEPYKPYVTRLVIDINALDGDITCHLRVVYLDIPGVLTMEMGPLVGQ